MRSILDSFCRFVLRLLGRAPPLGPPPVIALSRSAARQVLKVMRKEGLPKTAALRFGVVDDPDGGFQYTMGFDRNGPSAGDWAGSSFGVTIVVDPQAVTLIEGTIVDFYNGKKTGFIFKNPQAAPPQRGYRRYRG